MYCDCSEMGLTESELEVRLGGILMNDPEPGVVYAKVSRFFVHQNYIDFLQYDIALLQLTRPVSYTNRIAPICLPPPNVDLNQFKVCFSTGFGLKKKIPGSTLLFVC